MRAKALRSLASLGDHPDPYKQSFLNGVIECYDAISAFILRYAAEAETQSLNASGGEKEQLLAEAVSLKNIASGPAGTFAEALQLIWLVTLVLQKVCGCGVLNYSRMDQYLLPFYRQDLNNGRLDRETALELLREFFFKNNGIMTMTDHMSLETEGTNFTLEVTFDDPNYLTVGGLLPGGSGVNALSWLMLEAAHSLRLRNPFMVVRYHEGIADDFMLEVVSAIRDNTSLVVYNDETMIPALKAAGIAEKDVYNYGFFGCNDPDIPGESGGLRQLWWNLAKPLELALNQGDYPMQPRAGQPERDCQFSLLDRMVGLMVGPYYGEKTADLDAIDSLDGLLDLYRAQTLYLLREYRRGIEQDLDKERQWFKGHLRIEDCFLHGTVEEAVSWPLGGVRYHHIITQGTGLATVADSLYVIDQVVFKNKEMSLKEFAAVLAANYDCHEELRFRLAKRMKKFGNDIPEVDRFAKIVVDIFCDCVAAVNGPEYLYALVPTLSSDRDFTTMGRYVGATANGRMHGEKLSENQSPCESCDVSGLTALFNSLANVPFCRIAGGPLNVRMHPGAVKGEAGLRNFYALLKTYFQKGGMQVQMNVLGREELIEAKNNPERYKNLCIRVTGYSAFFVQMGEQAQNELIARTEQR